VILVGARAKSVAVPVLWVRRAFRLVESAGCRRGLGGACEQPGWGKGVGARAGFPGAGTDGSMWTGVFRGS